MMKMKRDESDTLSFPSSRNSKYSQAKKIIARGASWQVDLNETDWESEAWLAMVDKVRNKP